LYPIAVVSLPIPLADNPLRATPETDLKWLTLDERKVPIAAVGPFSATIARRYNLIFTQWKNISVAEDIWVAVASASCASQSTVAAAAICGFKHLQQQQQQRKKRNEFRFSAPFIHSFFFFPEKTTKTSVVVMTVAKKERRSNNMCRVHEKTWNSPFFFSSGRSIYTAMEPSNSQTNEKCGQQLIFFRTAAAPTPTEQADATPTQRERRTPAADDNGASGYPNRPLGYIFAEHLNCSVYTLFKRNYLRGRVWALQKSRANTCM
jgi:hypothetical protein